MKLRFASLAFVLLTAFPLLVQAQTTHFVGFDDFSFFLDSSVASIVNISQFAGDAPDVVQPGGAEAPHTSFALYTQQPTAETSSFAPGQIRIYRTADTAAYADVQAQVTQLQTLLASRPDLATVTAPLPYLPNPTATQAVLAQVHYVDLSTISGISYLVSYRQDMSPFTSGSFLYTFQGLSTDGASYVSAVFTLNTPLFPAESPQIEDMDAFAANYDNYLAETTATLNAAAPTDFTPSLAALDAMFQSFAFTTGTTMATPVPATVAPPSDPTLGGLAGTWNLVSYGDPAAPTPVLESAPITLTFVPDGASGSDGCNQYSNSFTYDNGSLTFGLGISTMMACEEAVMAQAQAYLSALQSAQSYTISGDQLQITYDGGVLTFLREGAVAPAPAPTEPVAGDPTLGGLAGTWNLVSYGASGAQTPILPGTTITLTFAPEGVSGSGGCNQYNGGFSIENTLLTIGPLSTTMMACEEAVMNQETAYLSALQSANGFMINGDQLQIAYDGGVLVFTKAA